MHADYIANPLYDNNPFIEALPPMLSGKDLIHALAVIPPYNDSDRDRSTGERLQLLSSLYEFYQPLSMTIDLYCEIYTAMQHCYGQYSPQSEAAAFQNGYSLMHGNALAASIGGGNSFSVVGVSGLGKSTALQRVLSLYPQVIEHTEYHGQKFYCHQISYLVVQTPHDASIKALILDIYLQIDSLIGTTYQKDILCRRFLFSRSFLPLFAILTKFSLFVILLLNRSKLIRKYFFLAAVSLNNHRGVNPPNTIKFHRRKAFICERFHCPLYGGFRAIYIYCNFFHRPDICIVTGLHCAHEEVQHLGFLAAKAGKRLKK